MLPKTSDTYDKILEILGSFPEMKDADFERMDLSDTETVRDLIKFLYLTLNGCHESLQQLKIIAELESTEYFIQHKKVIETN